MRRWIFQEGNHCIQTVFMQANAVLAWNYFNDKAAGRKPRGFKVMLLGWFPKRSTVFLLALRFY